MPEVNPPDVPGSPYQKKPGDLAFAIAEQSKLSGPVAVYT